MEGLWFPVYQTLARHPKTLKLARLLKIKRREAVGLLIDIFTWALQSADQDGVFSDLLAEDIAEALDYPRRSNLVSVLIEAGWLEQVGEHFALHDWGDYTGSLYVTRAKNREKNKRYRDKKKRSSRPPCDGHETVTETEVLPLGDVAVTGQQRQEQRPYITTTITNACARDEGLGGVVHAYLDKITPTPSQRSLEELKGYVELMGQECCLRAIDIALDAKAAKWSYIRKILETKASQGVRCIADWDKLEQERNERLGKTDNTVGPQGKGQGRNWGISAVEL